MLHRAICDYMPATLKSVNSNHTCAFLRRPPVLPPKMGDGVLGSRVGGFHGAFFSFFFSSATALLRERALRGTEALLRSAVPLRALWRDGAAHRGAADIIVAAMAAMWRGEALRSALCCANRLADARICCRISLAEPPAMKCLKKSPPHHALKTYHPDWQRWLVLPA